jgi:hypothetical protein
MVQVLFSEIAEAYMKGPRTFLTGPDLSDEDAADLDPPLGVMESLPSLEPDLLVKQLSAEVCPCDQPPATVPEAVFVTDSEGDVPVQFTDDDLPDCVHFTQCATPASCYKALIPLAKLKGLIDEMDVGDLTDFRCDVCSNCVTCKKSAREKTRSLQEDYEQEILEKSV